jgi:hypothetical protein
MRKLTHDVKIQLSDDISITVQLSENYNPSINIKLIEELILLLKQKVLFKK